MIFTIETLGIFTNNDIIKRATQILQEKLDIIQQSIDRGDIDIKKSVNTIKNSFDITLANEDYTIGKVLEYILYSTLYENKTTVVLYRICERTPPIILMV